MEPTDEEEIGNISAHVFATKNIDEIKEAFLNNDDPNSFSFMVALTPEELKTGDFDGQDVVSVSSIDDIDAFYNKIKDRLDENNFEDNVTRKD